MLLAQMEGFLEVARRGNVSRAAEAMFVTQPTLTARLHALERELGEPLFARTRRGMKLTDAGRAFLPYAERAMRAVEGRHRRCGIRAVDLLRPNLQLLRAHPGVLSQPGRHPSRGDGAGQHRVRQEDGAATARHRLAAADRGRWRAGGEDADPGHRYGRAGVVAETRRDPPS